MKRLMGFIAIVIFVFSDGALAESGHSTQLLLLPLIPGIVGGKPLNEKDAQHKKFVRLSNTGNEADTDCTGFILKGCVVTGKHCVKDKKKLMAMQGNASTKSKGVKFTDMKFLGGEARKDVANDLVILKPETAYPASQSFDLEELASENPKKEDTVIVGGSGYDKIFKAIEKKDDKIVETPLKLGIGTLRVGVNTVTGSLNKKDEPTEDVDKDSTNFLIANVGEKDFGNVDEADSGGPVFTMVDKKMRLAGIVSKRLAEKDKIGPSKAGAILALAPNAKWIKDTVDELKCSTATE